MTTATSRALTSTWLVLVALTVTSMASGSGHAGGSRLWLDVGGPAVVLGAMVFKGRRVLLDYLGLKAASPGWRLLLTSWLAMIAALAWLGVAAPTVWQLVGKPIGS